MADWSSQTTHNDISDFSDNPELRKELRWWRLKIAAVTVVVVAIVGFSARPAYRFYREYRIDRNLEEARVAARLEDWGTTRDRARSVLLARGNDFEAYRLWTRALGKMGEPRTYMAAAQLFTSPMATREDRLEAMQVMALQAPQALALSAYGSLSEELRDHADFRAAITPLLVQRGEIDVAELGLREASTADSAPRVQLELLRVLCARPTPERVAEARRIFAELIARDAPTEALAALLIMGETPAALAPGDPLPDLRAWVAGEPEAKTLHRLLALHPELETVPARATAIYDETATRFLATEPGVLGTWLVRQGQSELAVKLLGEFSASRSDAYIAHINALLRLDRDAAIKTALAEPPPSADMVEVEMIRAVIAARRGDEAASQAAWTRALNQAAFDQTKNRFIEIARAAEGFGATAAVEDAWVAAIRSGWGQLPLYRDVLPIIGSLATKSRTEDLLAVCRTLQRFEPQNPELANNVNYLGLLHGIYPPREAVRSLGQLAERHPEMPEIHSALILAELMAGSPEDAMRSMPKIQQSPRVSPLMRTALEGSARLLLGETARGTELLRTVRWNRFMRQERIVFRDLLVKLKISGLPLPELEKPDATQEPELVPAWRKAVQQLEKDRAADILPALPAPRVPGADLLPGN